MNAQDGTIEQAEKHFQQHLFAGNLASANLRKRFWETIEQSTDDLSNNQSAGSNTNKKQKRLGTKE